MKTFTRVTVLLLIFIFTLSSCSVHKRRYMQGYHVSWKKSKYKNNHDEAVKTEKELIKREQITSLAPEYNELDLVSTGNLPKAFPAQEVDPVVKKVFLENEDIEEQELKTSFSGDIVKSTDAKKPIGGGGGGKAIGVIFMIVGLLLFGLGFIFYTNLGALFGTVFLLMFGIGGAIFFIIGLVTLLVK